MSQQANFSLHSNSKGNLLKTTWQSGDKLEFVKTGRLQVRDFPTFWGIEPVIEVLCYRLGRVLGLNIATQRLDLYAGSRLGRDFETLVCVSDDFRNGKSLIYLQSLYIENEDMIEFDKLCRLTGCGESLIDMLAFDLIIMNEDRHNSNVGFLISDDEQLELAPIYDNGYSLLYDDIKGMQGAFKTASRHCLCNAPLYNEGFTAAANIFRKYSKIYTPTIKLDIDRKQIENAVNGVKLEYNRLIKQANNIVLPDVWWDKVIDFIMWRIDYVRDLRDSMEE